MLYVCATPIGNMNDISLRALEILSTSDIILCEDTRVSKKLLSAHHITYKRLVSMYEYNEAEIAEKVLSWLSKDLTITQISDAGTPSISDPGSHLCNKVMEAGFKVSPIPGACAYISLLSVAGIPYSKSLFYGFLPSNNSSRTKVLENWHNTDYMVCIYEAPHRIIDCITSIIEILGENRLIIMGRELTKQFETIKKCTAKKLLEFLESDNNQQRGEFVLLICPNIQQITKNDDNIKSLTVQQTNTIKLLALELPPKKAVNLTHKIVGGDKDLLYNYIINLK